ncbi:MAG: MFS transporter [Methanothrix soehngenii]|uniref:MFS transporter n=1 Tax=Methanothrix soehngenii TaxID=2223 RepID=UPI0023F49730|nr:MFS transporter [Methanothrix soehngenii]MDD5256730.1 MFS transporter [Methanothrix soehngenii]
MSFDLLLMNLLLAGSGYASKLRRFNPNARKYLLFVFLTTLNAGIYGVIFNLYILRLGFGEDFLGLILSISATSMGLFSIPAAFVCDRLGRKRTLLLSSVLSAISLFFLYNTTTPELLVLFSLASGMASALGLVTGSTFLLENSTKEERMYLFSMSSLIYTFSLLSGNMLGGFLPDILADLISAQSGSAISYRLTLYVSLVATMASLLPLAYVAEKNSEENNGIRGQLNIYRSIFKSKVIRQMTLFYCLYGVGWGTSLPYFNVYFDTVLGASANQIGIFFSVSQIFMILGYFLVPVLTERTGKVRLVSIVQILSIPFLLMFVLTNNLLIAVVGFVMRYMLMNMANPILNSFKLEIVQPEERSMINSIMWMACYTFVGIGNYVGGLMMAKGDSRMPFMVTGLFYAATAVFYYICFNKLEEIIRT